MSTMMILNIYFRFMYKNFMEILVCLIRITFHHSENSLKTITGMSEMDSTGSGQGPVVGSFNHKNEFSGSI